MHGLTKTTLGALLLSSTLAISAFAATPATPDSTGCPPGMHRAESEGSGVGSVNLAARKAESEGSGVGSVNLASRKAESEGSGVGTVNQAARKAESEGSGVGSVNLAARKAESEGSGVGTVRQAAAAAPCIKQSVSSSEANPAGSHRRRRGS